MLAYALPMLATELLLRSFGAADTAVLAQFASDTAVSAVGTTGSIIGLLLGFFNGLTVSSNVMLSRAVGGDDRERAARTVGCSVFCGLVFGIFLAIVGFAGAYPLLKITNCPAELIDQAATYIKIYFLGMPVTLVFNFAAALLRAVGDSFRPGAYLGIGGVLNVGLNIFCVLVLKLDVAGVAVATVIGQFIPTVMIVVALVRSDGFSKLSRRHFRFYKKEFCDIFGIGLPVGLQNALGGLVGIVVQGALNGLGPTNIEAWSVGSTVDGYVGVCANAIASSVPAFISQCYGAHDFKRLKKVMPVAVALNFVFGGAAALASMLFGGFACRLFTTKPEVVPIAVTRILIVSPAYIVSGLSAIYANALRCLDRSALASAIVLFGNAAVVALWTFTAFAASPNLVTLCLVYPVSWFATTLVLFPVCYGTIKRLPSSRPSPASER